MTAEAGQPPRLPLHYDGSEYDDRFSWSFEDRDGTLFLSIAGRATHAVGEDFAQQVRDYLPHAGHKRLLIDLRDCEQIASASLGFLVQLFRHAVRLGFQPVAICPQATLRKLMAVLGMTDFLFIVENEDMAHKFFEAQGI